MSGKFQWRGTGVSNMGERRVYQRDDDEIENEEWESGVI